MSITHQYVVVDQHRSLARNLIDEKLMVGNTVEGITLSGVGIRSRQEHRYDREVAFCPMVVSSITHVSGRAKGIIAEVPKVLLRDQVHKEFLREFLHNNHGFASFTCDLTLESGVIVIEEVRKIQFLRACPSVQVHLPTSYLAYTKHLEAQQAC